MTTKKTKWFRWPCGMRFEAQLTPAGRYLQYRIKFRWADWQSAGPVSKARKFAAGENPYGVWFISSVEARPIAPSNRVPTDTEGARRCARRVLKYLGVL